MGGISGSPTSSTRTPLDERGVSAWYATGEICANLREHARRTGTGVAIGDNVGFLATLPHR